MLDSLYPIHIDFKNLTLIKQQDHYHTCSVAFNAGRSGRLEATFSKSALSYFLGNNNDNSSAQCSDLHMRLVTEDGVYTDLRRRNRGKGKTELVIRSSLSLDSERWHDVFNNGLTSSVDQGVRVEHYDSSPWQVRMYDWLQSKAEVRNWDSSDRDNNPYPVEVSEVFSGVNAFAQRVAEGMVEGRLADLSELNQFTGMHFKVS